MIPAPDVLPYTVAPDGRSITCGTCGLTSYHPEDVYFRYCARCDTLLGPAIRRAWNLRRAELRSLCDRVGRYKRISTGGAWHKVPSEWVITQGVLGTQVESFPLWTEADGPTS